MDEHAVLLLGRSLLLWCVADVLSECTGLRVTQAANWAEAEAALAQCTPEVLIFELADAGDGRLLPLLCRNPQLMLVGLDAELNRALLLEAQETCALTLDQVRAIVERRCS